MQGLLLPLSSMLSGIQISHKCTNPAAPLPARTVSFSPSRRLVVMRAKREQELVEIRAKTTQEINDEVVDLKGQLFRLRIQKSARDEFKSSEFRRMHKRIARMLTVKRERELEEGIGKRLSRKLDRQWKKSVAAGPSTSLAKSKEAA